MTFGVRNFKFSRKVDIWEVINQNSSNLENVAMVTSKFGNADFGAPFDHKGVRSCHICFSKID